MSNGASLLFGMSGLEMQLLATEAREANEYSQIGTGRVSARKRKYRLIFIQELNKYPKGLKKRDTAN